MKYILVLLTFLFSMNVFAEHKTLEGQEELKNNKNIVQEIFYYACHHCQKIEEPLQKWENKVESNTIVEKVPVVLSNTQKLAAKHYYSSQYLSVEKEFSKKYFERLMQNEVISDELATEILLEMGEKKEKINEAFNSNWVAEKVQKAREVTLRVKINTVPTFLINNKFVVKRSSFMNDEKLFNYIERLTN